MSAKILYGAPVAQDLDRRSTKMISHLAEHGVEPCLAIVRVGTRLDDVAYERSVIKKSQKLGIATRTLTLETSITESQLVAYIQALNIDTDVHGVLLFRPLPEHISDTLIRNTLDARLDIDGITDLSLSSCLIGKGAGFSPCTPRACIELCDYYKINLDGKHLLVIGRSLVVGRPLACLALSRNATVTIAHSHTHDLAALCQSADLIICCVGHAGLIDASYVHEDQIIIDVGTNFNEDGSMTGDVNFEQVSQVCAALTPVPGGIGALTTSVLCSHLVRSAIVQLATHSGYTH